MMTKIEFDRQGGLDHSKPGLRAGFFVAFFLGLGMRLHFFVCEIANCLEARRLSPNIGVWINDKDWFGTAP
jgi:hypothetical protein